MISIEIPGFGDLSLCNLVLDLNGTLTLDGDIIPGVKERISCLNEKLGVHLLTADTLGRADEISRELSLALHVIPEKEQVQEKRNYLRGLSPGVAAIGNGRNDEGMLSEAALGIVVVGPEGASPEAISFADVVVTDINGALDLLIFPDRLKATLRS